MGGKGLQMQQNIKKVAVLYTGNFVQVCLLIYFLNDLVRNQLTRYSLTVIWLFLWVSLCHKHHSSGKFKPLRSRARCFEYEWTKFAVSYQIIPKVRLLGNDKNLCVAQSLS